MIFYDTKKTCYVFKSTKKGHRYFFGLNNKNCGDIRAKTVIRRDLFKIQYERINTNWEQKVGIYYYY